MKKIDKLVYNIIWFLLKYISKIPIRYSITISGIIGNIAYYIDKRHRKVALKNLSYAYGTTIKNKTRIDTVKKVYKNLCQNIFEIGWLIRINRENFNKRIKILGSRNLINAFSRKKGVLIISGHIGAWELLPYIIFKIGAKLNIVYRPLDFNPLDKLVAKLRSMFEANLISTRCAMPQISTVLRRNEAVGLLIDQSADWYNGVWVDFFGHRTCTSNGVARIALNSGASVVPVFIFRKGINFEVCFHKEVPLVNVGDRTKNIEINTANYSIIIEREIRKHPEQWFWVHRRWKNKAYSILPKSN